jgi:hypothetical protein
LDELFDAIATNEVQERLCANLLRVRADRSDQRNHEQTGHCSFLQQVAMSRCLCGEKFGKTRTLREMETSLDDVQLLT